MKICWRHILLSLKWAKVIKCQSIRMFLPSHVSGMRAVFKLLINGTNNPTIGFLHVEVTL